MQCCLSQVGPVEGLLLTVQASIGAPRGEGTGSLWRKGWGGGAMAKTSLQEAPSSFQKEGLKPACRVTRRGPVRPSFCCCCLRKGAALIPADLVRISELNEICHMALLCLPRLKKTGMRPMEPWATPMKEHLASW